MLDVSFHQYTCDEVTKKSVYRYNKKTLAFESFQLFIETFENGDESCEDSFDVIRLSNVLQIPLNLVDEVKFSLNELKFVIVRELFHGFWRLHVVNEVQLLHH